MKFLLDTDHISILQKQQGPEFAALMHHVALVRRADLVFCIVSFHEQVLGCNAYLAQAKNSADVERGYQMFDRVLTAFAAAQVLPFDSKAPRRLEVPSAASGKGARPSAKHSARLQNGLHESDRVPKLDFTPCQSQICVEVSQNALQIMGLGVNAMHFPSHPREGQCATSGGRV